MVLRWFRQTINPALPVKQRKGGAHGEADVAHLFEAAGAKAFDKLVRFVGDAAEPFAVHAARVVHAVHVLQRRPVGKRRTALIQWQRMNFSIDMQVVLRLFGSP